MEYYNSGLISAKREISLFCIDIEVFDKILDWEYYDNGVYFVEQSALAASKRGGDDVCSRHRSDGSPSQIFGTLDAVSAARRQLLAARFFERQRG